MDKISQNNEDDGTYFVDLVICKFIKSNPEGYNLLGFLNLNSYVYEIRLIKELSTMIFYNWVIRCNPITAK